MTDNCHGRCQQVISGCCDNNHQWQTTAVGAVNRLSLGIVTTTTNDRQLPWVLSTGYLRVLWQQPPMTDNCHGRCQQVISGCCTNNHQWQTTAMGAVNRLSQGVVTTTTNDRQLPSVLSTGYLSVLWQPPPMTDNCHRCCQQVISGCCANNHQWQTTAMCAVNRLSQGVVTTTTNDRQLPQALSTGYLRVLC